MALTSSNVRVAVTGLCSVAPTGTAAPTTSISALNVAFVDLGYVGDGGVTETRERTTKDLLAWQNATVVRTVVTDGKATFKLTLIESSKAVVELVYGTTTTGASSTDGKITVVPTATGGRKSFVIDVVDGAETKRIYIPQGEVTETGDIVYASGEPIGYPITITAYADATLGGSYAFWQTSLHT